VRVGHFGSTALEKPLTSILSPSARGEAERDAMDAKHVQLRSRLQDSNLFLRIIGECTTHTKEATRFTNRACLGHWRD